MGRRQQNMATLSRTRHWLRLVDCVLSIQQHAASNRSYLRRLSLRQLRHPHQTGRRVERRMRTLPRPRQRTRHTSFSGNILNPSQMKSIAANDTCIACHSQGQPLSQQIEGKGLRLAGGLSRWSSSGGLLEARRSHIGADDFHSFRGRDRSQKQDAGQRFCAERYVPEGGHLLILPRRTRH